jgi:flagellar hook-length control protein FliK
MTDALPPALLPAPPSPPAGLAAPGHLPERPGPLPGNAGEIPGRDVESDAFSLILNGFFGAALPQPAAVSPTGDPPAEPAFGPPWTGATPPLPPAPPAAPPLPDGAGTAWPAAPGTAAGTGKPLPARGEALPGTAPADGLAIALGDRSAPGQDAAGKVPGTTAPDTYLATAAATDASRPRTLPADALLAQLAFSRNTLRGSQPPPMTAPDGEAASIDLTAPSSGSHDLPANQASPVLPPVTPTGGTAATQAGLLANAGLAAAASGGHGAQAAAGPALAPLADADSFADGLGERLLALGSDGLQTARLRLHPETLGPLEVRIRVAGGQAEVWFGTQQGQARDAIEGTLPRLREMFTAQGLELGRVQVELRPETAPGPSAGWQGAGAAFANDRQPSGQPGPWTDGPAVATARPWAESSARTVAATGRSARLVDVLA